MDQKTKILSPTADDLRQLIICDTDFSEVGQTDFNLKTMQRLEQLGWLAEGDENGEYALTASGRLAVRRSLGDVVAFVQFNADRAGRTYIAGPMTGHADFNYPAFNAAAALLRSLGIAAINPADHGRVPGATWGDYLRSDIAQLATCESIYFLPGWSQSRGALLEHHIATSLGMRLLFADGAEHQPTLAGQGDALAAFVRLTERRKAELGELSPEMEKCLRDGLHALAARQPVGHEPVELACVAETLSKGGGLWMTCSGCHESNEGAPSGPYSKIMRCYLGNGCDECGGIGAIWDTTDYQNMSDEMSQPLAAPPTQAMDLDAARSEGHYSAVRYVLGYLNGRGDCGSTQYEEILNGCGRHGTIKSAVQDDELEFTGLGDYVEKYGTAEDRALIESGKAVGNG